MAKSHYSADSAPPPPPRLVFEFRSGVTGPSTASVPGPRHRDGRHVPPQHPLHRLDAIARLDAV